MDAGSQCAELSAAVLAFLLEQRLGAGQRLVIAVAGESGSGKSETATNLARSLDVAGARAVVLHQDDYFHLPPRANHVAREEDITRVGRAEVDLALLQSHVADFRAGVESIVGPLTNHVSDRFDTRSVDFTGVQVLVVEGTYVLELDGLDVRIFLEATYLDTLDRRRARARDVDSPFVEMVLSIEHEIVAQQAPLADVVVDTHFTARSAK